MKIGFLAMSGVRVRDEKLMSLGLTLPGFVERSKVIASLPSLGLLYLAAVTPNEHEVFYFEAEGDGAEPEEVYDCDLVAVSTFSAQIFEAYAVAGRLRERGVITAIGGLHATAVPEEAKLYFDHVVVGEGENVWPHLITAVEARENGRIWKAADYGPLDVAELPVPRYDLLAGRPYNRFTVQTSRGCPWRCEFCASSVMLGAGYRKRPVEAIVRDIKAIIELYDHPFIEFADDNTFVDKRWSKELCRALIPLKIKWFTETDISVADDPELLELMAAAGCRQVLIGLESPTVGALNGLERNANFKVKQFCRYKTAVNCIQANGITVNGCFILGLDFQKPDVFQRVYDFVNELNLYEVQITVLTPFPATPLYERLDEEKRLLQPGAWELCTLFDVNYQPKQMSIEELKEGLYWLAGALYEKESVKQRRTEFFSRLRRSAKARFISNSENLMAA